LQLRVRKTRKDRKAGQQEGAENVKRKINEGAMTGREPMPRPQSRASERRPRADTERSSSVAGMTQAAKDNILSQPKSYSAAKQREGRKIKVNYSAVPTSTVKAKVITFRVKEEDKKPPP